MCSMARASRGSAPSRAKTSSARSARGRASSTWRGRRTRSSPGRKASTCSSTGTGGVRGPATTTGSAHQEGRDGPVAVRRRPGAPVGARGRAARAGAAGARRAAEERRPLEDVEPELLDAANSATAPANSAQPVVGRNRAQPLAHPAGQAQLPGALPRLGGGVSWSSRAAASASSARRITRCGARWSRARRARASVTRSARAPDGMKLLAYGTRESNDIAWYPRSKKVYFRGVGLMTRLPELDYWDGE